MAEKRIDDLDDAATVTASHEVAVAQAGVAKRATVAELAAGISLDNLGDVVITSVADGQALVWDSSTSKWVNESVGGGGGGGSVTHKTTTRTAGDITLNQNTWTNVNTGLDLAIAAATGDTLEFHINAMTTTASVDTYLDGVTLVSGSPVNSLAKKGAAPLTNDNAGVQWLIPSGTRLGGGWAPLIYVVQAGDISGGTVTVRLRYLNSSTTSRTLYAGSGSFPLTVTLKNLGAAA